MEHRDERADGGAREPLRGPILQVQVVTSLADLALVSADYAHLHRTAANTSPFVLYDWHVAWCRHFLNLDPRILDRLMILVMRNDAGACVAVVPLIVSRRRVGPLNVVSVDLLGADPSTTESRGPLVQSGYEMRVARAVRERLDQEPDWDWIHWGGMTGEFSAALTADSGLAMQKEAPGYVIDLTPTWQEFRATLKRNIRESLRHCYNSLERDGHAFEFEVVRDPDGVRQAIGNFLLLHGERAQMSGTVEHRNHFASQVSQRFLYSVCEALAARDVVRVFQLRIGGKIVAVRIGFVVGDGLYFYYSGFDPAWAKYGVMTTTVAEALKYAIASGLKTANLSRGTDTSKIRWGPRAVEFWGATRPRNRLRSRVAFQCYSLARSGGFLSTWLLRPLAKSRRGWN